MLRGRDIRDWPLEKRKEALLKLLNGVTAGLLNVSAVDDGEWLYQQVRALGMEGIVAKRAGSRYQGGASDDWLKIKVPGYHRAGQFRRAPLA
ncbi:ATP-dependent DNA ligase [Cupriavidus basilensis]